MECPYCPRIHFSRLFAKFSITPSRHKFIIFISENIVCLNISIFIVSFFLSFTIDLYSLNPLTAIAIVAGIISIFCKNIELKINVIPCCIPNIFIKIEIVYPKQNPLYIIIPNTIGIPITVVPKNQIISANNTYENILFFNSSMEFIFWLFFNVSINVFIYSFILSCSVSFILFVKNTPKKIPIINNSVIIKYSFFFF